MIWFILNIQQLSLFLSFKKLLRYTPNANMADNSVVARDELHESEVSEASMICFENASLENSCFVLDLLCFISLCVRIAARVFECDEKG